MAATRGKKSNGNFGQDITASDYIAAYKQVWGNSDPSPDADTGLIEYKIKVPYKKDGEIQCVYFDLYANLPGGPKNKPWLKLKANYVQLFSSAKFPPKFDKTSGKAPKYMSFSIQGPKLDNEADLDSDDNSPIDPDQQLLCEAIDLIVKELKMRVQPLIINELKTYNQDKAVIKFTNGILNQGLKVHVPVQDKANDEEGNKFDLDRKLYRFRLPVCRENGLIGIKNTKKNEFNEVIFNNRLMKLRQEEAEKQGKPAELKKIAATLKSNGRIIPLSYKNVKNVVTSGSEAIMHIVFNANSWSTQGLSFACSVSEMYITTKPYVPSGPKISIEELNRVSKIAGPAEIEIDISEDENNGTALELMTGGSQSSKKNNSSRAKSEATTGARNASAKQSEKKINETSKSASSTSKKEDEDLLVENESNILTDDDNDTDDSNENESNSGEETESESTEGKAPAKASKGGVSIAEAMKVVAKPTRQPRKSASSSKAKK